MSEIKLKPCPFCGGEAWTFHIPENDEYETKLHEWIWRMPGRWLVGCDTQLCMLNINNMPETFDSEQEATEAWNKRAELPSAQQEITLESAIDYLHDIGWMQEHDRIMAESAPVVHAHWESAEFDDELKTCSNCHCDKDNNGTTWYYIRPEWRYCPHCGARMDGD